MMSISESKILDFARACVQVSRLPKDVLVEIDCIAVVEKPNI